MILSLLFIACAFVSCATTPGDDTATDSKNTQNDTDTDSVTDTTDTTDAEESKGPSREDKAFEFLAKLPQVNYNRTMNFLVMSGFNGSLKEIFVEEASSEPIDNAVFLRNAAMYDNYGVTVTATESTDIFAAVDTDIKANAKSYDVILGNAYTTAALAQSGYLCNFLDLKDNMNLNEEWWDPGTLRDCEIGGKVFFMNGDINYVDNHCTWIIMFNKKMMADLDLEEPYQLVRDGKWTLDVMYEYAKQAARDNGDGVYDERDTYGFLTTNYGGLMNFLYMSDIKTIDNVGGELRVVMGDYQEKISDLLTYCNKLLHEEHISWISVDDYMQTANMFMNNQGLFYSEVLSYVSDLSEMNNPYGVLPPPKYNESQKEYRTHVDAAAGMIGISSNTDDPEDVAYILEGMAIYSYLYVTPAYYDVTLKRKKSRDAESSEMIDIILRTRVYDIGYIHNLGLLPSAAFKDLVFKGDTNFASAYKSRAKIAERELKSLLKKYSRL